MGDPTAMTDGGAPRWIVEFARSSGCPFTIGAAYSLAADFLAARHVVRQGLPDKRARDLAVASMPVPRNESEPLGAEDVAPLLEMADTMVLQAEAAAALYKLANGGCASALPLVTNPEEAGAALTQLLSSSCNAAAHPAACALLALAGSGRAAPLLAAPGLLRALIYQVGSQMDATPGVMNDMLARALATAVHTCAVELPSTHVLELRCALEKMVTGSLSHSSHVAQRDLKEALWELKALA